MSTYINMFNIPSLVLVIVVLLFAYGCDHIKEVNTPPEYNMMHEITRYSDSGNIVEHYYYIHSSTNYVKNYIIKFQQGDTTIYMSNNITVKQWPRQDGF